MTIQIILTNGSSQQFHSLALPQSEGMVGVSVFERQHVTADVTKLECLYLNIWTPPFEDLPDRGLPIMVWLVGGGYPYGEGNNPILDGLRFVGRLAGLGMQMILIAVQHR